MHLKLIFTYIILYMCVSQAYSQSAINYYSHYNDFSDAHKARLKRFYIGYGIPSMSIDVSAHYVSKGNGNSTPPVAAIDATSETTVGCNKSFGGQAGVFKPFLRTGAESAIGYEIAASAYFYRYNIGPLSYGSATFSDQSVAEIIGVPLGIAFKSGGEVTHNKHNKSLISFGFGLEPAGCLSKIIASDENFIVREYGMLEVGVFAGIAWKLRATYYSGNVVLVNKLSDPLQNVSSYKVSGPMGTMDVKAVGASDFNIALLLMPFSWNWDKE